GLRSRSASGLSRASRKADVCRSASDCAAVETKSRAACCRSSVPLCAATGHAKAISNSARSVSSMSRPVTGIDVDVAVREVAGPEARLAFGFTAQREAYVDFGRIQLLFKFGFGKRRGQAAVADEDALHTNIGLGGIESHAGITGGGKDAAPVGVGAGYGGFDQRRICDGSGQARGGIIAGRASDFNGDEFLGAFAIARDSLRQVLAHGGDFQIG